MPDPLRIGFDVPFPEAIKAAVDRGVVLPDVYYGELFGIERQLAFSVAGLAAYDQLTAVRDTLTAALSSGRTFAEWKKAALTAGLDLPAHRLDNIFRTNLQGAYMAGKWEMFEQTKSFQPYLMYDAINDSRVRPSHLALDNVIRPVDDNFWHTHSPPNGYRCRCTLIPLTERQAFDRSGANKGLHNPATLPDGRQAQPDKGWDYSPNNRLAGVKKAIDDRVDNSRLAEELKRKIAAEEKRLETETYWQPNTPQAKWHDAAFTDAPVWIKNAVKKYDGRMGRLLNDRQRACYWPGSNDIDMGDKTGHFEDYAAQGTWRHEYGHFIDFVSNKERFNVCRSEDADYVKAIQADTKVLIKNGGYGRKSAANDTLIRERIIAYKTVENELMAQVGQAGRDAYLSTKAEAVGLALDDVKGWFNRETINTADDAVGHDIRMGKFIEAIARRDAVGVMQSILKNNTYDDNLNQYYKGTTGKFSDLIGCATRNKLLGRGPWGFGGHADAEIRGKGDWNTETFANLFTLLGTNDKVWQVIIETMLPKTVPIFKGFFIDD